MISRWFEWENYYQRLERLGWKHLYRSYMKDAYYKHGWIVVVPKDNRVREFFHRMLKGEELP